MQWVAQVLEDANIVFCTTSLYGHGFKGFYPLKGVHTEDVFWALQHSKGSECIQTFYTDEAKQFGKASAYLHVSWEHS